MDDRRRTWLVAALISSAALSAGTVVLAEAPGDAVVARVGPRTITVAETERRIAQIPPFQLRTFGPTADAIRRSFVERFLVREHLLSQGAEADALVSRPEVAERVRGILRSSLLGQLRADLAKESPVTDEDVKTYYEANRAKFHAPPRVALWRILVATPKDAVQVLADVKKDLSPKRWNEIARERSLDRVTNMRGGNLGFISPDGSTSEPSVRVDMALLEAASRVQDAELVPEPVKEGDQWAVVWRRQSMKAVERTLEQEAPAIRQLLAHQRADDAVKELLVKLRKERLTEFHPELVDAVDVTGQGELQPGRRPGSLPGGGRRPAAAPPPPKPTPGGLR